MKSEQAKRISKVMTMISEDVQADVKHYEGLPFSGRNVSEYFGKQSAAIDALAKAIKTIAEEFI